MVVVAPYHSGSIETTLLSIKGIKIVYPSNAADMYGLMKAAFMDPNPVVMLEHKGLYWSKSPGTEDAKTLKPSADYILPLGKANTVLEADTEKLQAGETCCIITYGMGVYWSKLAAKNFPGQLEIVDLRTLFPLDEAFIFDAVKKTWQMFSADGRTTKQFFCGSPGWKNIGKLFSLAGCPR